jgi:thioredoxin reductase (NADPH)
MMRRHARILVLGAGPAGYTAAIYAARAGLQPIILTGDQPGGQLTVTTDVENFPGFANAIQGPQLMEQMQAQAEQVGAEIVYDTIGSVDLSTEPFRLSGDVGDYTCDSLVVATGAKARWLGVPGERELAGYGVSSCATCDGFFFRGKTVVVIGGGNTAVEEALYLANLASNVIMVHRRSELRSERILQERLRAKTNVSFLWNHVVDEMIADSSGPVPTLRAIAVRHVELGSCQEIAADGAFVAIGHDPATTLFQGQIDMDSEGYLATLPASTATNIPGIFAAGDVQDKKFRQAVTAAGTGCMAALEAEKWLAGREPMRRTSPSDAHGLISGMAQG